MYIGPWHELKLAQALAAVAESSSQSVHPRSSKQQQRTQQQYPSFQETLASEIFPSSERQRRQRRYHQHYQRQPTPTTAPSITHPEASLSSTETSFQQHLQQLQNVPVNTPQSHFIYGSDATTAARTLSSSSSSWRRRWQNETNKSPETDLISSYDTHNVTRLLRHHESASSHWHSQQKQHPEKHFFSKNKSLVSSCNHSRHYRKTKIPLSNFKSDLSQYWKWRSHETTRTATLASTATDEEKPPNEREQRRLYSAVDKMTTIKKTRRRRPLPQRPCWSSGDNSSRSGKGTTTALKSAGKESEVVLLSPLVEKNDHESSWERVAHYFNENDCEDSAILTSLQNGHQGQILTTTTTSPPSSSSSRVSSLRRRRRRGTPSEAVKVVTSPTNNSKNNNNVHRDDHLEASSLTSPPPSRSSQSSRRRRRGGGDGDFVSSVPSSPPPHRSLLSRDGSVFSERSSSSSAASRRANSGGGVVGASDLLLWVDNFDINDVLKEF